MECGCANDMEFCDGCECARDVCKGHVHVVQEMRARGYACAQSYGCVQGV